MVATSSKHHVQQTGRPDSLIEATAAGASFLAMPKPATWTEREFSKVLEAEQKRILDLARAQHDAFEQSLHLSHPGFMNCSVLFFCWA